mmetsp:Transcript_24722/g.58660  ORF Transcript_24722/g.58660 Transcript_24722/m.58660 type:complete len:353 (-) Transcript_24722:365-1423(-)
MIIRKRRINWRWKQNVVSTKCFVLLIFLVAVVAVGLTNLWKSFPEDLSKFDASKTAETIADTIYNFNDDVKGKPWKKHKLGFVHIPKTGGSSCEVAGANAGFNWGSCMFKPLLERGMETKKERESDNPSVIFDQNNKAQSDAHNCPSQELLELYKGQTVPRNVRNSLAPWHAPLKCLPVPYYKDLFEELFAVVRNPYMRMISEYYFSCEHFGVSRTQQCTSKTNRNDPSFMNVWIQQQIRRQALSKTPNPTCDPYARGHFIRQYDFVYGWNGERRIEHILRMEHLEEEFRNLMKTHNLDHKVVLPKRQEKKRDTQDTLTVRNFTNETIDLIREFYSKDFVLGGYSFTLPLQD